MSDNYASQVILEVNGQQVDDFQSVTQGKVEGRKLVQLMNKWGFVTIPKVYPLTVDYIIPADSPEFDFESVANGTLTIDDENGHRTQYGGVYWLSSGDTKREGGKETIRPIDLAALRRNP
jgi:hypothetical protein